MSLEVDVRHGSAAFALDAAFDSARRLTALFGRSGVGQDHARQRRSPGSLRPGRGRIVVDGTRPRRHRAPGVFVPRHRRRVGYVFQEGAAVPAPDGAAEPALRPLVRAARATAGRGRPRSSSCSASAPCSTAARPASPAARSSAWRSAARCWRARGSSDGRAARRARRGAQGRDPALHRAAARRGRASRSSTSATRSPRWRGSPPPSWCSRTAGWSRSGPAAEVLVGPRLFSAAEARRGRA